MLNCIVAGLLAAGIVLAIIVLAAVVIVLATGTGGAGGAFAAAVIALLAEWWISIAVSLGVALAAAFTLCMGGTVETTAPVSGGTGTITIGLAVGATIASAVVTNHWKVVKWRKLGK